MDDNKRYKRKKKPADDKDKFLGEVVEDKFETVMILITAIVFIFLIVSSGLWEFSNGQHKKIAIKKWKGKVYYYCDQEQNVEYLITEKGFTVRLDKDGKPVQCSKTKN